MPKRIRVGTMPTSTIFLYGNKMPRVKGEKVRFKETIEQKREYVAEELLGECTAPLGGEKYEDQICVVCGWLVPWEERTKPDWPYKHPTNPTWLGTWDGAGAVVEAMEALGWEWEMGSSFGISRYCVFWKRIPPWPSRSYSKSAPDAVISAAYDALKGGE